PEAVDAIQAAMRQHRNWPTARLRPRKPYGENEAEFGAHLKRLEDLLVKFPDDPVLLFLLANEWWFDGQQDKARLLLRRARPLVPDPTFIDRFLEAKPGGPVVIR